MCRPLLPYPSSSTRASTEARAQRRPTNIECGAQELKERLDAGTVTVLDVREPHETAGGVIPGRDPLGQLERRWVEVKDADEVVYCAPGARSLQAAGFLRTQVSNATSMDGGIYAWTEIGGETASG